MAKKDSSSLKTDRSGKQSERSDSISTSGDMPLELQLNALKELEKQLDESGGEITEDQDIIWQNQKLKIAEKVDAYGIVLTNLETEQDKLKVLKQKFDEKMLAAINRNKSKTQRLKSRLHKLCEGSPLRGHIFSFHPYIAKERKISEGHYAEVLEIESKYTDLAMKALDAAKIPYSLKTVPLKVSELPNDHPAIIEYQMPSVRIT